jgi:ERCC4-type nuclease
LVEYERGENGLKAHEVLALVADSVGFEPVAWAALYAAAENLPKPKRGSQPGTKASSRRGQAKSDWTEVDKAEWTPEDMEAVEIDIKTHPLTKVRTIIIDHREPGIMVDMLRTVRNLHVEIAALETGDYVVEGQLVVERKTAVDFANSILDGRIFLQADRMAESGLPAFLLIEGNVYTQTNLTIVSLTGALSWLGVQGIRIIPTLSPRHTAHMIAKLTRHVSEGLGYVIPYRLNRPKEAGKVPPWVLEGIPGVSAALSLVLHQAFGSIVGLCRAEIKDLLAVPGIGPAKAKMIYETLRAGPAA